MSENDLARVFLDSLVQELEVQYQLCDDRLSELSVYNVDLSALRLRLSTTTPFIVVTAEDMDCFGEEQVADWVREELIVRQNGPGSAVVLLEQDGSFLEHLGKDPYWAPILCGDVIRGMMRCDSLRRALLEAFRSRVPLRFLSPYEPKLAVTGSQFYGRSSELNLILSHPNRSFALEGGRRIGKTSLLKEVRRVLLSRDTLNKNSRQIVWYDFWGYKGELSPFFEEVVRHFEEGFPKLVRPDFASYFPRFIARMRRAQNGPIIFLLDEVDDLIEYERKFNFPLLGILKRTAQVEDCRLLIAGFRNLSEELNRHDTPLTFCHRIRLENLTREQTMAMLRTPMASMGVKLDRQVFSQILNDTGGHPQLVQFYGQALIEILDTTGERFVTMAHVQQIRKEGRLYDALIEMLIDNTNDLEFALVYNLVDREEFGLEDMDDLLKAQEIRLSVKQIHNICRRLVSIGVLSRRGQSNNYQFAIPLQPILVRNLVKPEFVWRKATEQIQPGGIGP